VKRFLLAAALGLALLIPLSARAQTPTDFVASGGDVTVTIVGFQILPFQFYLAANGPNPERLILDETGSQYSLNGGAYIDNTASGFNTPLNLGPFTAGTVLQFGLRRTGDNVVFSDAVLLAEGNGFKNVVIASPEAGGGRIEFSVAGINASAVVTPEPSTMFLFATGLIGLGAIARRRMA
jgi:hypothetical protein